MQRSEPSDVVASLFWTTLYRPDEMNDADLLELFLGILEFGGGLSESVLFLIQLGLHLRDGLLQTLNLLLLLNIHINTRNVMHPADGSSKHS